MEKIDIHNYEAFFLDHLEGNLSEEGQEQLSSFLAENPELLDELNEMGDISILSLTEPTTQLNKEFLKADPAVLSALTVDDWMITSVEGDLSTAQTTQLNDYVAANGLEKTFKTYQATKLEVNQAETFGSTSNLKRKGGFVVPMYAKWASVAAILLVGFLTIDFNSEEESLSDAFIPETALNFQKRSKTDFGLRIISSEDENVESVTNSYEIVREDNFVNIVIPEDEVIDTIAPFIMPDVNDDPIVNLDKDRDSSIVNPDIVPVKIEEDEQDEIAETVIPAKENDVVTEEPYKLFTNATGNLLNRDVSFTRDRKKESDDYVAYHFKVGRFEFDRKKSK